jgi:hypothetical protein
MHLMVRAVVAESDPLEECPKATGEGDSVLDGFTDRYRATEGGAWI